MKREDISAALVRELLDCDYETGAMTWRKRKLRHCGGNKAARNSINRRIAGRPARSRVDRCSGQFRISIMGVSFLLHRVVWAHYHGRWPVGRIDHIHGQDAGNGIANLRDGSAQQNSRNMKLRDGHPSGVMGVRFDRHANKFIASISKGKGRMKQLGRFEDFADAVACRKAAEPLHGYSERHGLAH